jgi:hypothetical protein
MRRIHLLTASAHNDQSCKLSPISPNGTTTSDLGISPRSSITAGNWLGFRQPYRSSSEYSESDGGNYLLSPNPNGVQWSPSPFSPFSDYCSSAEVPSTPASALRTSSARSFHFNFEPPKAGLLAPPTGYLRERSQSDSEMACDDQLLSPAPSTASTTAVKTGQFKKRLLEKYEREQEEHQQQRQVRANLCCCGSLAVTTA